MKHPPPAAPAIAKGFQALDPRAKIVTVLALILICVSTPPENRAAFAGYFLFIAALFPFSGVPPKFLARRMAVVLPFAAMTALFIPFMGADAAGGGYNLGIGDMHISRSGLAVFWNVLVKAAFGAACAVILSGATPFPELLAGLERMRMPRIATVITGMAYRYLFVLRDEALRMKRARDSRAYKGRWLWEAAAIGQMAGALFLRSYERGERVYLAMAARGFSGHWPGPAPRRITGADYGFVILSIGLFLFLREGGWTLFR